ncbi:SDR family NAD(P)-dependent oxidoreductase [Paenibacillus spongiae]|uniref:SDR family oxidoreductase n=1 Tax=Paenibacillus spongiae TaxID=2909671 RepID=A0ABY5SFA2_9BACL|nr:SDR family NAD(P)-dependent oxidoreductase [Paenibacillus spongiae]UVI31353.1 SDR family oxidoreductase [Paenibacillus spongiae]
MRLKDKVALITGGSLGIGLAVADRFAREGATVIISGRGQQALDEAKASIAGQGGHIQTMNVDVQYKQQVDQMIDKVIAEYGRIDIVVNNAGICSPAPFLEITEEEWERHMAINLKGTFLVSQRAAQEMVKAGTGGTFVHMSSVNGLAGEADQAHYNSSKGGMNLLAMSMAVELARYGIRVNSLCPGFIATRLTQPLIDQPEAIEAYLKTIPMGRVGQPEEIADAALFLACDESRYITGHCLVVDGGQLIKLS